jgi:hypothetical protein
MASTGGNGSTETKFDAGSVMPHTPGNVGGYQAATYSSNQVGGKKHKKRGGKQQNGGSLAFSELRGGKRRSKKSSKKASKKISNKRKTARRGKKTMKTTLKGLIAIFKK